MQDLIVGELIPTAGARLSETGDVMKQMLGQFKAQADGNADALITAYNSALSDWTEKD